MKKDEKYVMNTRNISTLHQNFTQKVKQTQEAVRRQKHGGRRIHAWVGRLRGNQSEPIKGIKLQVG